MATGASLAITLPSGPTGSIYVVKDAVGGVGASYPVNVNGVSGASGGVDGSPTGYLFAIPYGVRGFIGLGGGKYGTL